MGLNTKPARVDGVRFFQATDWFQELAFDIGQRVRVLVSRGHERFRLGTIISQNVALWELDGLNPRPYQVRLDDLRVVYRFHEHELMETDL